MRPLASLLIVTSCLYGACGGDGAGDVGGATTAGRPAATRPAPKTATTATTVAAADAVGAWTFDVDGFVETNWEMLESVAAPGLTLIRQGQARIAALPAEQREEAMRRVRASLSPADLEIHDVALQGPEALKAWAKKAMRKQLAGQRFELEFRTDGSCSLLLDLKGHRSEGEGTWTRVDEGVTVRLTNVDGSPAKARDREPKTLALRDDRLFLEFVPGGPKLVAKRRD